MEEEARESHAPRLCGACFVSPWRVQPRLEAEFYDALCGTLLERSVCILGSQRAREERVHYAGFVGMGDWDGGCDVAVFLCTGAITRHQNGGFPDMNLA